MSGGGTARFTNSTPIAAPVEGHGSRVPGPVGPGSPTGKATPGGVGPSGRAVDAHVYEELGFARCGTCGSLVLEGVCVQCNTAAPETDPESPPALREKGTVSCSKCSSLVVSGARFCGSCGEAVHASSLALARVRDLRSRLETMK